MTAIPMILMAVTLPALMREPVKPAANTAIVMGIVLQFREYAQLYTMVGHGIMGHPARRALSVTLGIATGLGTKGFALMTLIVLPEHFAIGQTHVPQILTTAPFN